MIQQSLIEEQLALDHKGLLAERFKKIDVSLSEYSFANLYLFRHRHDYKVMIDGKDVFVSGRTYNGMSYIMPTIDIGKDDPETAAYIDKLIGVAGADYDLIFPIPEEWLKKFEGAREDYVEEDSDYIYTVEKLSTYKGQKLHGQKNLLNQCKNLYEPYAKPLTKERLNDAKEIVDQWLKDTGVAKSGVDYHQCMEALDLNEELVLCGLIYYAGQEPAGFLIGENINKSMFALHFAKAKRKFKGIYQFMYNDFANILPQHYEWLNFEQDLGISALKIAKSSYHPDRKLKKYRILVRHHHHNGVFEKRKGKIQA
jgi:hypothetical protein